MSDVPVGVFLSRGIDSSINAELFSEGEAGLVKTFSIGYGGEYQSYQNELHYARLVPAAISEVMNYKDQYQRCLQPFLQSNTWEKEATGLLRSIEAIF